jgi:hypothetical protein
MNQKVHPAVVVILALVVLAGVGFLSMKLFPADGGANKQVTVKADNPNDPKFKADPKLSGGGGG